MSEVVLSSLTNVAGDHFLNSAEPGAIIQVQQYTHNSVWHNTNIDNKECAMPGNLGNGTAVINCEAGNRILVECTIHFGNRMNWRGNFIRMYWNGGKNDAPAGEYVTASLDNAGTAYGVESYIRTGNSLLWGGGAGCTYNSSANGTNATSNWTILTPPVDNKGSVNFMLTVTGHNNGNHMHLNNNSSTGSDNANQNNMCSSILLKEVYYP